MRCVGLRNKPPKYSSSRQIFRAIVNTDNLRYLISIHAQILGRGYPGVIADAKQNRVVVNKPAKQHHTRMDCREYATKNGMCAHACFKFFFSALFSRLTRSA